MWNNLLFDILVAEAEGPTQKPPIAHDPEELQPFLTLAPNLRSILMLSRPHLFSYSTDCILNGFPTKHLCAVLFSIILMTYLSAIIIISNFQIS